jgi:hypothetical protein
LSWTLSPFGVNPYAFLSSEPALMGIADYGVGPKGPYVRETTQWMGAILLYNDVSLSSTNAPWSMSFQLNVNLHYVVGNHEYDLWVQDVMFYNTLTSNVCFENNIVL